MAPARLRPERGKALGLLAAFLFAAVAAVSNAPAETGIVAEVVDGDTLRVRIGDRSQTVRLIGIDAPEQSHPRIGKEFFGAEASAYLASLCQGKTVRLERDREDRDRYDRLLRYVFLPAPDSRLLNLEMLRAGMARVFTRFPFSRREGFAAAEELARRQGRGLWKDGGAAEARWVATGPSRPVEIFPSGGRRFVVAYGGWAKNGVAQGVLEKEIDWLLRNRAERSDAEFARMARGRGYAPLETPHAPPPGPAAENSAAPKATAADRAVSDAPVRWDQANRHVDETIVVEGTIVRTHRTANMLYLNFHPNWKRYLTVVIHAGDLHRFPGDPETAYRGKKVRVRGEVQMYKDRPEMVVRDPADIAVVP
jgi:endonuclease YncB( thermonuclease family)